MSLRIQNKEYGQDDQGIGSIKAVAAIAGIGIVFLLLFIFVGGAGNTTKDNAQNDASQSPDQSSTIGQPAVIRIPDNYSIYANKDYKFSMAYPTPWAGAVNISTPTGTASANAAASSVTSTQAIFFNAYALGSSFLNGLLSVYVEKQDAFKVTVHPDGAVVVPVKLGGSYGWKVVQTGSADPTLKVGDSYAVKSSRYQSGIPVYNFSTMVKNTVQTIWVFQSGNYFIGVTLPTLSRQDGSAPGSADVAQYTVISNNIAKTLRPAN